MKTAERILCITLVIVLLSSGLPCICPQDVNQDMRVDLEDAILGVKNLARTVDRPGTFLVQAQKALTTLQIVARVKAQICPPRNAKSPGPFTNISQIYLIPSIESVAPSTELAIISESILLFQSIFVSPDAPPPRSL